MSRTRRVRDFLKASKQIKVGQSLSLNSLLENGCNWLSAGRYCTGTWTVFPSGGLLDIWPQSGHPVRLDFFGDEIDTIRRFDPGSQRTVDKLAAVLVTPAPRISHTRARQARLAHPKIRPARSNRSHFRIPYPILHPFLPIYWIIYPATLW